MTDETSSLLELQFGTTSPFWRLPFDSSTLELAAVRGPAKVSVHLNEQQCSEIRLFGAITSHTIIDIKLFDDVLKLHLVGKKVNETEWAGTASAYGDTNAVARDLVAGLSFAEQVVSEVNALVAVIDQDGLIQRFNRKCEEFSGLKEADVIGKSGFQLFMSEDEGKASKSKVQEFFAAGESYERERYLNTINGPRLFLFRNKFVRSGSGKDQKFLICAGTDITDERNAHRELMRMANTDGLTGLPNRNSIHNQITSAISAENGPRPGILFIDLDNFKRVNDHYGHVLGDQLLKDVSKAIGNCLSEKDSLARLGGDEFLVLSDASSVTALEETAARIVSRLRKPFSLGHAEIYTGCSIGIAAFPEHGDCLETLIRSADTAMYAAKDAGKGGYKIFSPEMDQIVAQYMWLDTNLRRALDENQLVLHYQPVIALGSEKVHAVEALVRWQSPDRGMISPMDFIPFAEQSGLIIPLGLWVMTEAALQAARWKAQGRDIRISVNVSVRQLLNANLIETLSRALSGAGLTECALDLEITESCFIDDETKAVAVIQELKRLGARIYLDDFGTGYSSLSQLSRLPLDVIKLDRSFITSIDERRASQTLVRSMVAIASEMGFDIVAEGVETLAEANYLKSLGIKYAQGYLYSPPMSASKIEAWVDLPPRLRLIA